MAMRSRATGRYSRLLPETQHEGMDEPLQVSDYVDLQDSLVVTGEHGDQLFGSILMEPLFSADVEGPTWLFPTGTPADLNLPWRATVTDFLDSEACPWLKTKKVQPFITLLAEQAAKAPFEIVSLSDWLWWCNYSLKWQCESYNPSSELPSIIVSSTI